MTLDIEGRIMDCFRGQHAGARLRNEATGFSEATGGSEKFIYLECAYYLAQNLSHIVHAIQKRGAEMTKVTPNMEQELFRKGLVIRRIWQMPDRQYEYTVYLVGTFTSVATRMSLPAAYNAAIKYLEEHEAKK